LPVQFVIDLSSKYLISEIDRFCQYFHIIEKVKRSQQNTSGDDALTQINSLILQNKAIQPELRLKTVVNRKFTIGNEMYDGGNVWLIKPNDFNRGRGVMLFNTLEQLRKLLKEFSTGNEMDFYVHNVCV
jgi:hypothetical protein